MKPKFFLSVVLVLFGLAACTTAGRPDLSGMSFSDEPLIGKFIWHDLITEDINAARKFYGGLFGWSFEQSANARGKGYLIARSGNAYVAGLMPIESQADGGKISRWLPFVSVADVDDSVAASTAAGGQVVANARDVPLGRVAAIIDPQGAVFGLARSAIGDPDDKTTAAAPGRAVWTELHTSDAVAATSFYKSVVGYDAKTIERRGGKFVVLGTHGRTDGGILKNPVAEWKPAWMTFFGVEDPAAAAELAVQLGGTLLLAPSADFREGRIALVADPSGAILVLRKWAI